MHGSTDKEGMTPATDPSTPDDVAATIFPNLGLEPQLELNTPTVRPMRPFRRGRILQELIG